MNTRKKICTNKCLVVTHWADYKKAELVCEPVCPVGFIIHACKMKHFSFKFCESWEWAHYQIPKDTNDSRHGERNFTNISVGFCCNPILQDVENWVRGRVKGIMLLSISLISPLQITTIMPFHKDG